MFRKGYAVWPTVDNPQQSLGILGSFILLGGSAPGTPLGQSAFGLLDLCRPCELNYTSFQGEWMPICQICIYTYMQLHTYIVGRLYIPLTL